MGYTYILIAKEKAMLLRHAAKYIYTLNSRIVDERTFLTKRVGLSTKLTP